MSIRWKILLLIGVAFALAMSAIRIVEQKIVYPSFVSLERDEATKDMNRCVEAIQNEIEHLLMFVGDWSAWDDTYEYVQDDNEKYRRDNLVESTYKNNKLNLLYICDLQGKVVYGEIYEYREMKKLDLAEFSRPSLGADHPLVRFDTAEDSESGILTTEQGPMLIVAKPILKSDNTGAVRGSIIMGRFLDEERIQALIDQTSVQFAMWPLTGPADKMAPVAELAAFRENTENASVYLKNAGSKKLYAYSQMVDIRGNPALLLKADIPKVISARGEAAMRFATASTVGAMAVIVLLIWALLEKIVVAPLGLLTGHASQVGQTDDLSRRLDLKRKDEIGTLAAEFDRMVKSMADSRARLVELAHRAGVAETAINVLHNVGNAINTVGVTAEMLSERISQSKVTSLCKATCMIEEHRSDLALFLTSDDRGRKLLDYLPKLSETLFGEQRRMLEELDSLQDKVRHIKDIIEHQQQVASGPRFAQDEDLALLVQQAVDLQLHFLVKNRIQTEVQVDPLPRIQTNKRKFLQVLENLIKNGAESVLEANGSQRRLVIRAHAAEDGMIRIDVQDTGAGIEASNLERIFRSGFTTKSNGHGFGLHFCANAMTELGGRMEARSEGPGHGATFTLWMPVRTAEVNA